MGCLGHRKKLIADTADQKWDYINLGDFKAKGCGPAFAYFWLWIMLLVSVAVYGLDSFTAVNLLILDNWSSKIEPGIPFAITKWIFSVCIILSFVNLGFEGVRAFRVIKRGNVADSYLDPLAVRWESIRPGSGQGWRRFLVFAELTQDRQGAEYVALFTYFNLTSWIRVLVCSGPRQVINVYTFKSVYESKLAVMSPTIDGSLSLFFEKIRVLAEEDYQQVAILAAMAFTLIIWVFSLIFFLASCLAYVLFLWHWIPRADGGLSGYCERKVNQRLKKVVTQKVNRALAKGQHKMMKAEYNAAIKNGEKPPMERMATLPTLPNVGLAPTKSSSYSKGGDGLPEMPTLSRSETFQTLPVYTSRPSSPGDIEMNNMPPRRPMPSRTGTMTSAASYGSRAPLLASAAETGRSSPVPTLPEMNFANMPPRPGTAASQRGPLGRPTNGYNQSARSTPTPQQYNTYTGDNQYGQPPAASTYQGWGPNTQDNFARPPPAHFDSFQEQGRSSPIPSAFSQPPGPSQQQMRSATGPVPSRGPYQPPQRNMTAPVPPQGLGAGYYDRPHTPQGPPQMPMPNFNRPGTSHSQRGGPYGHDVESQRKNGY